MDALFALCMCGTVAFIIIILLALLIGATQSEITVVSIVLVVLIAADIFTYCAAKITTDQTYIKFKINKIKKSEYYNIEKINCIVRPYSMNDKCNLEKTYVIPYNGFMEYLNEHSSKNIN